MQGTERIRQAVKTALSFALYYSGGLWAYRRTAAGGRPVILMYHRVLQSMDDDLDYSPDGMTVSVRAFEMQMEYLSSRYRVVPLSVLAESHGGSGDGRPLCAVTFDDGWKDVYDNAYPVLRRYGLGATVFLTTEYIEGRMPFWEERLRRLMAAACMNGKAKELEQSAGVRALFDGAGPGLRRGGEHLFIRDAVRGARRLAQGRRDSLLEEIQALAGAEGRKRLFLSWEEAREMAENGVEFGSHTVTHASLESCGPQALRDETEGSRRIIEQRLKRPVTAFAYPYGKHSAASREAVERAGYACACSTTSGFAGSGSDRLLLRRINIHQGVSFCRPMFACRIARPFNLF